jgi:glycosyltransferase involved in cell wall biosynthesis
MRIRLAIIVSHAIQHFAPWHRELAKIQDLDAKVFFCRNWGSTTYLDPGFNVQVKWDIPLLDGYNHEFLSTRWGHGEIPFLGIDNPGVTNALSRFSPDVVQVFGYSSRTNWRVAAWARHNKRPLLIYSDSNAKIIPAWWKRHVKNFVVRQFYDYVDAALFVGDNNRDYHLQYGIPADRLFQGVLPIQRDRLIEAVPNIDTNRRELRSKLGIPGDAFVVLFCGKFTPRKRPLDLVVAAHALARKGLPVWALLVGEGQDRSLIEDFCTKNGVRNIVLTGFVNQSVIPRYYACSDVLAVPSAIDPHPLVVTESSAFGLPIIASDSIGCIGHQDTAQPGRNALVYPCGNVHQLEGCIERLWREGDLYRRMGAESSRIAQSQDVRVAARQLAVAVRTLHKLGPRDCPA